MEKERSEKAMTSIVLPTATGGVEYKRQLAQFALTLIELSESIGFRMSARGWAYTLEGLRLINKNQFDRVESLINSCREKGYLPIDFTAEEEGRKFSGVEKPTEDSVPMFLKGYVDYVGTCEWAFTPGWWKDEQYYIQMLVEKIDLKTLFEPVCKDYKIPIATSKGWSSMLQRAEYARRFKEAEEQGLECVLLYCGDLDADGLRISQFLFDNLDQIKNIKWEDGTTGYDPQDLIINRFGLNYDSVTRHGLTWIDNLITGSGKNLADPRHKNFKMPYVQEYIKTIGVRKCEANAIVKDPPLGRALCRAAIESYLGKDARDRFKKRREEINNEFDSLRESLSIDVTKDLELTLNRCIDMFSYKLEQIAEQEENNNEDDDQGGEDE
jgi:hypothetical protein